MLKIRWMWKIGVLALAIGATATAAGVDPFTPTDCDALCRIGLGRCVHNKCPIRICRCG